MNFTLVQRFTARLRRRSIPTRLSSLLLLLQRSPLVKLLPEARVISTSGFSDVFAWTVTAIAGLGAFDSVSGATTVAQSSPSSGSTTVPATAGNSLVFSFQLSGANETPATFQVTGTLPPGLKLTGKKNSKSDTITGIPMPPGPNWPANYAITIKAWENADNTGRSATGTFNISVAAPPAPTISAHPSGGNFQPGQVAKMSVTATSAYSYTWKRNNTALPTGETILFSKTSPRKYLAPTADIGSTWRTDPAFVDTAWASTSGGIGYDSNTTVNFNPAIAAGGNTGTGKTSVYIRMPFTLNDPLALSYLNFKYQCDDGFIAYLNGTEIASYNKPTTPAFNSVASGSAVDADALVWQTIAVNQHLNLLNAGNNILAVHALNQAASSSDMLFNCELSGGINTANSSRLVLAGLRPQDAGTYTATVTNPISNVTSNPASIVLPPSIETQPASLSISSGQTALLSVVSSISPATGYQWYRGDSGDTANPVAGATLASFTTPALTVTTSYWVRLTNGAGNKDSDTVTVTVMGTIPTIDTQPASTSINSGTTAQLSVAASGTTPLSFQWYAGVPGDTSSPVSGATMDTFTTPALTTTTTYWVRVTNTSGFRDSDAATVTVLALPPSITSQPVSTTIPAGSTAQLVVVATGTAPFTYEWFTGESGDTAHPIAGASAATFTTPALLATTSYWVRVTNAANFANSAAAIVTVEDAFTSWKNAQFTAEELANSAISGPTADPDGDGVTNENEYVFGSLPKTSAPAPQPAITVAGNEVSLSFTALSASGAGYAGRTRHYAIETITNVTTGTWTALPGYEDLTATGQTVTAAIPASGSRTFCRLKVWLTP